MTFTNQLIDILYQLLHIVVRRRQLQHFSQHETCQALLPSFLVGSYDEYNKASMICQLYIVLIVACFGCNEQVQETKQEIEGYVKKMTENGQ